MIAEFSQKLLTPTILLWMLFSLIAALMLFSAISRRRSRLVDLLRSFVSRTQPKGALPELRDDDESSFPD